MYLFEKEILILWHHSVKFDGHKYYGSDYMIVLVCHMILPDQVIKGPCDNQDELTSCQIWWS